LFGNHHRQVASFWFRKSQAQDNPTSRLFF
jgi:hypothetical protein